MCCALSCWNRFAGNEASAEPIVQSWLEFGPEVRGKIATVAGVGKAEGQAWISSRFGVGLYVSNEFQIRLVPANAEEVAEESQVDSIK